MNPLVRTNIRQSLARELTPVNVDALLRVEPPGAWKRESKYIPDFIYGPLPIQPWFYVDDQKRLRSCQEEYYGFYAMGTMIRSVLRAVGFLVAGDGIPNQLYSPAILCYYTCAYHTLTAFLAGEGRVITEPALGPPLITVRQTATSYGFSELEVGNGSLSAICGILTRGNHWIFEGRSRSHGSRWKELLQVDRFKERAPTPIRAIADYLSSYGGELLCDPAEVLEFGIGRIPEIRHAAAYEGYGADSFALEVAMDMGFGGGTHLRRRNMGRFARDWLDEVLIDTAALIAELKARMDDRRKAALRLTTTMPMEYGHLEGPGSEAYEEILGFVYAFEVHKKLES
jgi:hypothetical protein